MVKNILKKSNDLINIANILTLSEQKYFDNSLLHMQYFDETTVYEVHANFFKNLIGSSGFTQSREKISNIFQGLISKIIDFYAKDDEKDFFIKTSHLAGVKHIDNIISFQPSEFLKPYIFTKKYNPNLAKNFTEFDINILNSFKSKHDFKFYQFIKSKIFAKNTLTIKTKEIYRILNIETGYYKDYHRFNQKLLTPMCKRISEISDLKVEFTAIKNHLGKIAEIEFKCIQQEVSKKVSDFVQIPTVKTEANPEPKPSKIAVVTNGSQFNKPSTFKNPVEILDLEPKEQPKEIKQEVAISEEIPTEIQTLIEYGYASHQINVLRKIWASNDKQRIVQIAELLKNKYPNVENKGGLIASLLVNPNFNFNHEKQISDSIRYQNDKTKQKDSWINNPNAQAPSTFVEYVPNHKPPVEILDKNVCDEVWLSLTTKERLAIFSDIKINSFPSKTMKEAIFTNDEEKIKNVYFNCKVSNPQIKVYLTKEKDRLVG